MSHAPIQANVVSLAAAGLLAAAIAVCASSAGLVIYAAIHAQPFGPGAVYEPALPVRAGLTTDQITVTHVVAGGPAWTMGLRPGWVIDASFGVDLPGAVGACSRAMHCSLYHDLQIQSALAARWIFELVAIGLVAAAVAMWRRRPRLAGVLGLAAIGVSAPTYALLGHVPLFPALYAASLIAPPIWLRLTGTHAAWNVILFGALLLAASWIAAWIWAPGAYDVVDRTRVMAMIGILIAGSAVASGRITRVEAPTMRERVFDALAGIAAVAWAVAVWSLSVVPLWVAAVVSVLGVIAYLALRNRIGGLLSRVNLAELGQRATLQALEAERSRVARDLHDVPLQELAAVIHRLDKQPGTASEAARLREIAGHLRDVTVSLRPPVLDDVGLGAALAEFAERRAPDGGSSIRVTLDDRTSIDPGSRPPADVELAVFRIVQEALVNAQRHAESSLIEVGGVVARDHLRVAVTDDGRGIDDKAAALAAGVGRLGLASMRERAAAIHATLTLSSAPGGAGTSIIVEWNGR